MKSKLRIILVTILFLTNFALICNAQTDLGIGIVSINFNDKTIIHFYEKPTDRQPTKTIEFFNDKSINSWNIKNLETERKWLKPEVLWLDYSSFNFRCKSKSNIWFEVIVNNENGNTLWIKKNSLTKFSGWESYLKSMFGVKRNFKYKQVIRKSPSNNSTEIKYVGRDCFQVMSMKNEWIEIFTPDYCEDGYTDSKTKIHSGWIKWKKGNTLLIDYFITS